MIQERRCLARNGRIRLDARELGTYEIAYRQHSFSSVGEQEPIVVCRDLGDSFEFVQEIVNVLEVDGIQYLASSLSAFALERTTRRAGLISSAQ